MKSKEWLKNNRDKILKYHKDYYIKNKEKALKYAKEYREKNKNKLSKYATKYQKKRIESDEAFAVKCRLRKRLNHAFIKYSKVGKQLSSDEYGIDYQKILDYIGSCPGKRSDFDIDHIIPLNQFDFDDSEQIKSAFAPENHRWLLKGINRSEQRRVII